ncbi:MAG: hypothetical protein ABIJ34_03655 [archaeon]
MPIDILDLKIGRIEIPIKDTSDWKQQVHSLDQLYGKTYLNTVVEEVQYFFDLPPSQVDVGYRRILVVPNLSLSESVATRLEATTYSVSESLRVEIDPHEWTRADATCGRIVSTKEYSHSQLQDMINKP